jgi:hypothetical protein
MIRRSSTLDSAGSENTVAAAASRCYQLKYVNLRARAEPIRLLLTSVGLPFEDRRENFLEFAKRKDGQYLADKKL